MFAHRLIKRLARDLAFRLSRFNHWLTALPFLLGWGFLKRLITPVAWLNRLVALFVDGLLADLRLANP